MGDPTTETFYIFSMIFFKKMTLWRIIKTYKTSNSYVVSIVEKSAYVPVITKDNGPLSLSMSNKPLLASKVPRCPHSGMQYRLNPSLFSILLTTKVEETEPEDRHASTRGASPCRTPDIEGPSPISQRSEGQTSSLFARKTGAPWTPGISPPLIANKVGPACHWERSANTMRQLGPIVFKGS
jgi:hypothetical protein